LVDHYLPHLPSNLKKQNKITLQLKDREIMNAGTYSDLIIFEKQIEKKVAVIVPV